MRNLTFYSNRFINNDRLGFQIGGSTSTNSVSLIIRFRETVLRRFAPVYGSSSVYPGNDLEWSGDVLTGNGGSGANTPFVAKGFAENQKPQIVIHAPQRVDVGQPVSFSFHFARRWFDRPRPLGLRPRLARQSK